MSDTPATAVQRSGITITLSNIAWLVVGLMVLGAIHDVKKSTIAAIEATRVISTKNNMLLKYLASGRKLTPYEIKQIDRFGELPE